QLLHGWKERGYTPYPLSVNISRVNLYNPNLVEMLLELVSRYELEPGLLNLELTESAYTDNPATMKKVMAQLQDHGFLVMMDDFGSGYSSLALLKDIEIDVLKIDMQFLSVSDFPGRGENIIASVIRMAKWLGIPVVAEGAETAQQVDFLRSVGCDYVQGYYYARPMPVAEYEALCGKLRIGAHLLASQTQSGYRYDDLFSLDPEMKSLFGSTLQAAVIYEFSDDRIEPIRVNEAYYALLGHDAMLASPQNSLDFIEAEDRELLLNTFRTCAKMQTVAECDYRRLRGGKAPVWIHAKLHPVSAVGGKHIMIGELSDITLRREVDAELEKYKTTWLSDHETTRTALSRQAKTDPIGTWPDDAQSVLNAINDSIYVCDKETHDLIYANNSLCKRMGITREDCKGKKCYEVLMHSTKPCAFCSMPTMEEGKMYTRLFRIPNSSQNFLMHGENISRNGTVIHLEVAVDVTDVDSKNLCWSEVSGYEKE
ncbi:MAG: EAL domain-containing protein, partial [Pseudoflavonifractor sp.]